MEYLIVVDMQNDFIDGVLGTPEAVAILPAVEKRIREFTGTVFFTRDTHHPGYMDTQEGKNLPVPHCIKDSEGWRIHPGLDALRTATPFDKPTFGSVGLAQVLRAANDEQPIERVTLIGVCTDICVISNALLLKAFLPETEIVVDASCCAGVTPESHENALKAMAACQVTIVNG